MDDPVSEIRGVVLQLTTGSRTEQKEALERYFTKNASFKHPFCSVTNNRDPILRIFQWYKILSPHIGITINSVAYDAPNSILYVNISQIFKLWFVPAYKADVNLTTVLQLRRGQDISDPSTKKDKYYIESQNDLYQVDQFVRFFLPWSIGVTIVMIWHWFATLCCILGANIIGPVHWFAMDSMERSHERWMAQTRPQLTNGEATEAEQRRDSKKTNSYERPHKDGKNSGQTSIHDIERLSNLGQSRAVYK